MRLSQYFLPLIKETPKEAETLSHILMLRTGMIRQLASGLYYWLPLGVRVMNKINDIIRNNLNNAGCLEMLMPCIQPSKSWELSGRYDSYGPELLRIKDRHNKEFIFAPTCEELITEIFAQNINSYKLLPKNLYQIQWKFRDEIRPRFGVMRAREFLLKDAYSFHMNEECALAEYYKIYDIYLNIFKILGLNVLTTRADTGQIGGNLTHEFNVISDTGETNIIYEKKLLELIKQKNYTRQQLEKYYAATDEIHDKDTCTVKDNELATAKTIEVGQIFYLGDTYTKKLNTSINNKEGKKIFPKMGTYGIGISRVIAAIIETNNDEHGIVWPDIIAPFTVSIINLDIKNPDTTKISEEIYKNLSNIDVLYDDTNASPGQKLKIHDLIGIPWQVIISSNKISKNLIELKNRRTQKIIDLNVNSVQNKIIEIISSSLGNQHVK